MPTSALRKEKIKAESPGDRTTEIVNAIEKAAHLLPSQGPITAFVHHNTLHAFEDMDFHSAVAHGQEILDCKPYLSESEYRTLLEDGRIQVDDIAEVVRQEVGSGIGLPHSVFGIETSKAALAMFSHDVFEGHVANLNWIVSDADALNTFLDGVKSETKTQLIDRTKHWVMRDLRNLNGSDSIGYPEEFYLDFQKLSSLFDVQHVETWDDQKWESFVLHLLWKSSQFTVGRFYESTDSPSESPRSLRDLLLYETGQDSAEWVNSVLIPFTAGFIDQGFASWTLPNRGKGFFNSFVELYSRFPWFGSRWRKQLSRELVHIRDNNISPLQSIESSIQNLGFDQNQIPDLIRTTLLGLRGFAGMIWQLETRSDRAEKPVSQGTLVEFTAVKLLLDKLSFQLIARDFRGFDGRVFDLASQINANLELSRTETRFLNKSFFLFELCQYLGIAPKTLLETNADQWPDIQLFLDKMNSLNRRRIFHEAYERRFRNSALSAMRSHLDRQKNNKARNAKSDLVGPEFQIVCCIDDREESFRRHLEEGDVDCETYGAAGFFAVPMYYKGAADAHHMPLCPAVIKPDHFVEEEVAYSLQNVDSKRKKYRRTIGTITHQVHIGSRTFTGGWIGTALIGAFATVPLVARVLFPRLTGKIREWMGGFVRPPEITNLNLEEIESNHSPEQSVADDQKKFTKSEMAEAVIRLLTDIGLQSGFSEFVFICGHGSSSLNNPHETAYNCGACAGGKGGPNARAFAIMANDPKVREMVREQGIHIPNSTLFIGCYHDTASDEISYFDLDIVQLRQRERFERAQDTIAVSLQKNAKERSRRFDSARLSLSPEEALEHVEERTEDLSQARPEYNHATNALCLVGRRSWSRGLFLDRRAFLQSYDPSTDDPDYSILERILQAVIPVCAGINLEYYFSKVDPAGYGAGNKLPHNITSMLGVMDGAASDLRPGLYCQMTEIHEPMRLLFVIETTEEGIRKVIERNEGIRKLCDGSWVQLAIFDVDANEIRTYKGGQFKLFDEPFAEIQTSPSSLAWCRGWRHNLDFASVGGEFVE